MMNEDNILNVKVPAELRIRVCTGVTWFDNLLTHEGGMVPSLVYMLSGAPGAGKSTLTRQIADGLTGNDYIAVLNSGEESKEQIAISIERLNLKHGFIVKDFTSHLKLLAYLDELIVNNPGKRVILIQDSIQKLTAEANANAVFEALEKWAKKRMQPVVIIFQVTKQGKFKGDNSALHDSDVQIELTVDKKTGNRSMNISKNRFGPVTDGGIAYICTATGLELQSDPDAIDDEKESDDVEASPESDDERGLRVGLMVRCNKRAHHKHRDKVGKVAKVGRTRVTVRTLKGEELYLPKEHVTVEQPKELERVA